MYHAARAAVKLVHTRLFASDDVSRAELPELKRRPVTKLNWFLSCHLFAVQRRAVRLQAAISAMWPCLTAGKDSIEC